MYEDRRLINSEIKSNINEFQSYYILINLDAEAIVQEISKLDRKIRESDQVRLAIRAFISYKTCNYYAFTRLLVNSNLLQAIILNRYLNRIRLSAICLIRKSCLVGSNKMYIPQEYFMRQLLFKINELAQFCKLINCDMEDSKLVFCKSMEPNLNVTIKMNRNALIDKKFGKNKFSQIINGCIVDDDAKQVDELLDMFKKVDFFNNI